MTTRQLDRYTFSSSEDGEYLRDHTAASLLAQGITSERSTEIVSAGGVEYTLLILTVTGKRPDEAKSWCLACLQEGIGTDSKFVIFSEGNAHAVEHNRLMGEFFKLRTRIKKNIARREKRSALASLGLKRVKGALGGVYYE